jgi:hypothetical protein
MVFPSQWDHAKHDGPINLQTEDVQLAFASLVQLGTVSDDFKFAFFIDGLNEFDGDSRTITKQLFTWTSTNPENVKLCVSSRELPIFTEAFSTRSSTKPDIKQFVAKELTDIQFFERPAWLSQDSLLAIVDKINDRADGVWLWVNVIVRIVLEALLLDYSLPNRLDRIDELPCQLDDLY